MTNRHAAEQAIAADLALIDLVTAFGTKSAKAKARKHRKACIAEIKRWNREDGLAEMSIDEILAALES